jgi:hypothetical protein
MAVSASQEVTKKIFSHLPHGSDWPGAVTFATPYPNIFMFHPWKHIG